MRKHRGMSRFKGVHFNKRKGLWAARIQANSVGHSLGYHFREDDAALAYDEAARRLFGEFAFADRDGMIDQLASQPSVYRCMVEKLYLYSGRLPNRIEAQRHIDELTTDFVAGGYQLRDLLTRFVTHPSFTSRRGEP